jgi:hypothetical protein
MPDEIPPVSDADDSSVLLDNISAEALSEALTLLETLPGEDFTVGTSPVKVSNETLSALAIEKYVLSSKLLSLTSAKVESSAALALQSVENSSADTSSTPASNNKFKIQRLEELQAEIEKCTSAMYLMPDADVDARVNLATQNPCVESTFYLNAMYKENYIVSSEVEAKKYRQTVKKVIRYENNDDFFNDDIYNNLLKDIEYNDNIGFGLVVEYNRIWY